MAETTPLELLARGGAIGAFLGLALTVLRGPPNPARATATLFCLAAAAHTLTQLPSLGPMLGWAWPAVWGLSAMGAGLFWAFAAELFEDRARLEAKRFIPALALLAVALAANWGWRGLWIAHNAIGAALIVHALILIARGWRGDLVEPRRRLRGPMLGAAAVYALVITAVQSAELFVGPARALSPLAAVLLLSLALLALAVFARADAELFGPAAKPAPDRADDPQDTRHAAALDRLMRQERVYRLEGLSVGALAGRLSLPEYRLRRLINGRLGHRNFAAFLNQWRLEEASAALADPDQRDVPISTIALDAGFQSLGPFNRAFKAKTGLTPTEFRARALKENG